MAEPHHVRPSILMHVSVVGSKSSLNIEVSYSLTVYIDDSDKTGRMLIFIRVFTWWTCNVCVLFCRSLGN